MIGLAIIIVLLVLLLPQALFIVPQQNVYIIERLGKFNRTVGAGLNIKIPFFETIAAKVDMRTRQEQFGIDAKTRDNVTVTMAIAAQYRVSAQPAANGSPRACGAATTCWPTPRLRCAPTSSTPCAPACRSTRLTRSSTKRTPSRRT